MHRFVSLALLCSSVAMAGGRWEFSGNLADGSDSAHVAKAMKPTFAPLPEGQALGAGVQVDIPDAPDLRLSPGFEVSCRFRMDERPPGAQVLVTKDKEYLLRVDWTKEGGNLSFFVYAGDQWEPRARGPVVKVGEWYETRARWDGLESVLQVGKDQIWTRARSGVAMPTDNPVQIGPFPGLIDRVEIRNPGYERRRLLEQAVEAPNPRPASATARYTDSKGWSEWSPLGKASKRLDASSLLAAFPDETSLLASPALAVEAGANPFLCIDAEAPMDGCRGEVQVYGSGGYGIIPFSIPARGRTLILEGPQFEFWHGTIRRLALRFESGEQPVRLRRFLLSSQPEGRPFLRVRSFAPGRAKLRVGREETLVAVVNNLGADAEGVTAKLTVPQGIAILDGDTRTIEYLGREAIDLLTWRVRADREVNGEAKVVAMGTDDSRGEAACTVEFLPPVNLPRTGYVPQPMPATTDYINLMHYCALWKEGTHYGWGRIEPWPDRRPAIGWYDEGTPEVADWHIKYALDHGISGFIYCWYRSDFEPEIHQSLGHAIHEGLHNARYRDQFNYCIMWENGCAKGVKDADDLLQNLFPFWMENYFTNPSYLKIDNQPVLFVWRPEKVGPQLGGTENTRKAFDAMRAACRAKGFAGLRIIGCLDRANPELQKRLAAEGWDATSGYGLRPQGEATVGMDSEGVPYSDHAATLKLYRNEWEARRDAGSIPDIPNVMMGWDPRPWHGASTRGYRANPTPAAFEAACRDAKELVDAKPADAWERRLVVLDNWTEFGEGHYLEPVTGFGFDFVNTIKHVFCTKWAPEALTDVVPADVGLAPPERRYQAVREAYGDQPPWRPRKITGDLVAYWDFDTAQGGKLADGSGNGFGLATTSLQTVGGRGSKVLQCRDGAASHPTNAAFFPPKGITISLWCKPEMANQSDRWLVSTVRKGADGYRLGFSQGRPAWQVPKEKWSHSLVASDALPVDEWSHVVATFDDRTLRLYVNGKQVGTLERPGLIRVGGGDMNLGSYGGDRACFVGQMDDVRIHNRPLSAEEIAKLAANQH
jgi:hypothetical protein